jgi:hypothetical protein
LDYKELRISAAEYMRQNPDDFTPFLYLEDGNFDRYCNDIENTACWGGQLEVRRAEDDENKSYISRDIIACCIG